MATLSRFLSVRSHSFEAICSVAHPRDTDKYRCGVRLASHPQLKWLASEKTDTAQPAPHSVHKGRALVLPFFQDRMNPATGSTQ
jgi:hypothetical protein